MSSIVVTPCDSLFDDPLEIYVDGLSPSSLLEVTATIPNYNGRSWLSRTVVETDKFGRLLLTSGLPAKARDNNMSSLELVASMKPVSRHTFNNVKPGILEPVSVELSVRSVKSNASATTTEFYRRFADSNIEQSVVVEQGVVGTLFAPAGEGSHPAVILLSGSGGGLLEDKAALLASRGFVTFALGYFGMSGLPPTIANIPLEYFGRAINWLLQRKEVKNNFLGIIGRSRGAELALLLASIYPEISAVVAYAPSSVIHGSFGPGEDPGRQAAWNYRGKALDYLEFDKESVDYDADTVTTVTGFLEALKCRESAARAAIQVERIMGPVLLISGTDDQMWPGAQMGDAIVARLRRRNHPFDVDHLRYDGAGHCFGVPNIPQGELNFVHPVDGKKYAAGGSPKSNGAAALDSWQKVLCFLNTASSC